MWRKRLLSFTESQNGKLVYLKYLIILMEFEAKSSIWKWTDNLSMGEYRMMTIDGFSKS